MAPVWAWSSSTTSNNQTFPATTAPSTPQVASGVKEFRKSTSSFTTGTSGCSDDDDDEDWPTWFPEELTELEIFELEERRTNLVRRVCLFVVSLLVLLVCFLVVRTDGVSDPFVYICLGLISAILLLFTPLRCLGLLASHLDVPLGATVIWLLCLLLCLAPVSRKQILYGVTQEDQDSEGLCEEGAVAQWISLVLALTAAFLPMPALWYGILAQLSCATYLVLGLALPRPECNEDQDGRSVFGGPLLGLPPLTIATFHLYSLVAVLMCLQYQITSERRMESVAAYFLRGGNFRRSSLMSRDISTSQGEFVIQIGLETLLEEVCCEERRWKRFVQEVRRKAPWGSTCSTTWLTVVGVLVEVISMWRQQLQSQPGFGSPDDKKFVEKVLDYAHEEETSVEALTQFVTDAVAETMEATSVNNKWDSAGAVVRMKTDEGGPPSKSPSVGARGGGREYLKTVATSAELQIGEWDFNALGVNRQNDNHVLQVVGLELLRSFKFFPPDALPTFLQRLEKRYNDKNPYHTHIHAADMTNAFFYLVSRCGLWQSCEMSDAQYASMIIAGLGHDVGHFGRNNMFLISKRAELALTYNDRSVLENMHASTLVRLLDDAEEGMKLFGNIPADQVTKSRHLMIHLILGTDTQKHLEELGSFRFRLGAEGFDPFREVADQNQVFSMLFRSADIGHSAKEWDLHREWSTRVTQEFHAQGDEEKALGLKVSPLCEREGFKLASSQVGFLQFICLPTWRELSRLEEVVFNLSTRPHAPQSRPAGSPLPPPPKPVRTRTSHLTQTRGSTRHSLTSLRSTGGGMENTTSTKSSKSLDAKAMRRLITTTSIVPLPSTLGAAQSTPAVRGSKEKNPHHKKRWLTEVCLALCEKNFQAWKAEQDADRVEVASNRSFPPGAPT